MSTAEHHAWADKLIPELHKVLTLGCHVVILAGVRYGEFLIKPIEALGCTIEIPMEGLGIGE